MTQASRDPDADDQPCFQSPTAVVCLLLLWLAFAAGSCAVLVWGAL